MQINKRYYVYRHVDPLTNEIVYIGKGTGGRAWDTTRNKSNSNPEHLQWMLDLQDQGYTPQDWVQIILSGLEEKEAFTKEKEVNHLLGVPRFSRNMGEDNHLAKLTNDNVVDIFKQLQAKEKTHRELANQYGVSRTCISHIASRKQWKAVTACLV